MASLLNYVQNRTASFFTKVSADTLWKAITSCRAGGVKKGRMRAFKKPKDLNKGQELGSGPINMLWPGLNSPIEETRSVVQHRYLKPDPMRLERMLAHRQERKLIGRGRKLHPMERGWSGRSPQGRKFEPPPPVGDENFDKYTFICLKKKAARIMQPLGRTVRHSSLFGIGNGNGLLGYGFAMHKTSLQSTKAALQDAPKRLQYIHRLDGHTVYHDFYAQCCGVRIFVQRKPKGYGLRCHRVIKALCELAGITDLHAKVDGATNNYKNVVKAFVTGLLNQETHQELAERKRLHVVEFKRENGYLPRIVASPKMNPVRSNDEVDKNEVLDVEDMYGENRFPYNKPTFPTPYYLTERAPSYVRKVYLEHPYRNLFEVKRRLMAEGFLKDGSFESRFEEAKKTHEKVLMGEKPMPIGLGLPDILRKSLLD